MALPSDETRQKLSEKDREVFDWLYANLQGQAALVFGMACGEAATNPKASFWEIMRSTVACYKKNFGGN